MKKEVYKAKIKIKKDDTVIAIAGKDKGKKGKVLKVFPKENKAIAEGINMVTKHVKPSAENPQGQIKKMEAPIHISNLMVVDPKSGEPTRVGRMKDKDGKLKRFSKKTNEFID